MPELLSFTVQRAYGVLSVKTGQFKEAGEFLWAHHPNPESLTFQQIARREGQSHVLAVCGLDEFDCEFWKACDIIRAVVVGEPGEEVSVECNHRHAPTRLVFSSTTDSRHWRVVNFTYNQRFGLAYRRVRPGLDPPRIERGDNSGYGEHGYRSLEA